MMRYRLLGPLGVVDDEGRRVDVGGRQPRVLLAVLLLAEGRRVTVDALVDAIWGEDPPASATGTVQSYVSRLRRRFGADQQLTWDEAGYRLDVDPEQVDARRFDALAEEGRSLLAAGRPDQARAVLRQAEELWRGPALADFADCEFAMGPAARLEQRRLAAIEDRLAADLALGRSAAVIGELSELVGAHPLREGLRTQLALALYRSGRQAEALRALADAARTLREELGIEPSRPLRDLESAILAHDPSLDLAGPAVTAPAPAPAPAVPRGPALVGRDHELGALLAALDEAVDDARFVVIEGEPGIGKTRLADELRTVALSRGAVAVWGRSDEGGAAPALWPWLPPLRTIAARAGDVPVAVAQLLAGEVPMAAGQARAAQFERFEAVAELLEQVSAAVPVVVLLDDLQWADDTSLELLAFLAGRLGRGVLVAGTMRQLEVGRNDAVTDALAAIARRPGSRRLQLRGLAPDATAVVLEAATHRTVAASLAATIHARAEGNPFYAIELSRLADEEGGMGGEVPATVGDVIRRRLARLPQPTLELLGVAAVVGRDVEMSLLSRAADRTIDAVLDGLEPAVVHRLLVEVPELPAVLRFSHALVREVVLEDMTSLRRARLHLKVADAIETAGAGVDDAEILAEHLWRAAPVGVGSRAAEALERSAEVALRRVAYAAAEDSLTKAVQLRRATGTSAEDQGAELQAICRLLEVAKARRYFQGASNLDVLDRAKELAERSGRTDLLVDLIWYEWSALATACRGEEAEPLALLLRDMTAGDPRPQVRAVGHQVYAVLCWGQGRIAEAVEHLDIALDLLAQAPPAADAFEIERQMVTNTFWLWHHAVAGDLSPEEAFARFDAMIAASPDRFAVASICGFGATCAITLGRWDAVEHFVDIGASADASSQFAFWSGQFLMQGGIVAARRGDVDEGVALFAEGKARYTGVGGRSALSTFEATLGLVVAGHGRLDDAGRFVGNARAELDAYGERWNEPVVLLAEAVVAGARGDGDRASRLLDRAAEVATAQGAHALAARAAALAAPVP